MQFKRDHAFLRTLFLFLGLGALFFGVRAVRGRIHLLRDGVRTTGHVLPRLGHEPPTDSGAHPDIAFQDSHGQTVQFNQNGMGSRPVGAAIPILYDPASPTETAVAASAWQFWVPALLWFWFAIWLVPGSFWFEVEGPRPGRY